MARYAFPVILEAEPEGGFSASFAGVPGHTQGETEAETLEAAADALVTVLAGYVRRGEAIPRPPAARGRPVVTVTALEAAKLGLHDAMLEAGMSNVELARRLDLQENAVRRLRDPLHRSHIGEVERALHALGRRVDVDIRAVA